MKRLKILFALLTVVSILMISGCAEKINIQTENEAVEYLKNYVQNENIYEILEDLSFPSYSEITVFSSSYAQSLNGEWFVIIHMQINQEEFSYVAMVSTDGQITEEEIYEDTVYIKREIY